MIKIQCPAKINLTLEVLNKRADGFHNIQSIMQTIDLYDILTIDTKPCKDLTIKLSGSCQDIPYDEKNIVYKAAKLFYETVNVEKDVCCEIYIEKNIPISAGLAGGSTDAAGTLFGLNKIYNEPLDFSQLHELCSKLGSDLNVCLEGGCLLATGRGENIEKLPFKELAVALIKPLNLGISAKEGYTNYANLEVKPNLNKTAKMVDVLKSGQDKKMIISNLHNDLEIAAIKNYEELRIIKNCYPDSIMSGSGSTYFTLEERIEPMENYYVKNDLKTIENGVCVKI